MLNGISQIERLDELYDLVQQSKNVGIDPLIVANFKGKAILDNLHDLKVWHDSNFFKRQTYKEFQQDPLGSKLLDAWAATNSDVIKNVKAQKRVNIEMNKIAQQYPKKLDLECPSIKRQLQLIEEENLKNQALNNQSRASLAHSSVSMQIDKRVDTKAANDASNGKFELKMQKL